MVSFISTDAVRFFRVGMEFRNRARGVTSVDLGLLWTFMYCIKQQIYGQLYAKSSVSIVLTS